MRLFELAAQHFFHGTDKGEEILAAGKLVPTPKGSGYSNLTPMVNRNYITTDLSYALMYAVGGNIVGHEICREREGYGYIFKIHKSKIKNRLPDEDVVGEITRNILSERDTYNFTDDDIYELKDIVDAGFQYIDADEEDEFMSPYDRFLDGEYEFYAAIGKYILKNASRRLIARFAMNSPHHSGEGEMVVDEAWKFKKSDAADMNKDGSDFFDYATRVK